MGAGGFEKGTLDVLIDNEFCIFAEEVSYTAEDGYIPEGVMQFTATVDEVTDDNCVIVKTDTPPERFPQIKKDVGYKLTIVKDLCTKKVVGYAFSNRIDTALTLAALRMAVKREHPAPGLMFHSDRGVQYAAAAYREKLEKLGFVQSMSRKGEPHDNAVAENFFSCLKCELVYLTSYATRRQAQNSIFRYIEGFYNPVRPHSSIGWLSPMEYARQLKRQNVA